NILRILHKAYTITGEKNLAIETLEASFTSLKYNKNNPLDFSQMETPIELIESLKAKLQFLHKNYKIENNNEYLDDALNTVVVCDSLISFLKLNYEDVDSRKIMTSKYQSLYDIIVDMYYTKYTISNDVIYLKKAFRVIEKTKNTFLYENIAEDNSSKLIGIPVSIINEKQRIQDSIIAIKQYIESLEKTDSLNPSVYTNGLSKLNKFKDDLYHKIGEIKREYPKYFDAIYKTNITTVDDIVNDLSIDRMVISYLNTERGLFVISLSKQDHQFVKIDNNHALASLTTELVRSIKTSKNNDIKEKLFSILLFPFLKSNIKSISIISDKGLSLIPFEILIDPSSKEMVILNYNIDYQYSATMMHKKRKRSDCRGTIVMAPVFRKSKKRESFDDYFSKERGVSFRDKLTPLLETEKEVITISTLFKGDTYLESMASEHNFKSNSKGKVLIHLATHGIVDHENPDYSRLYFSTENDSIADGQLYAYEIVNMDLGADLVTLSACNTGVGKIQKGEGVASLGRAFAYANCPNQLISLWPVNDKSTTEIMELYYLNVKKGMGKSTALVEAKRYYIKNAPQLFKNPYYWAGFVYYGDDAPLQLNDSNGWLYMAGITLGLLLLFLLLRKKKK
ncbi:MAG: CHAT domain-containing protein, partial [Saprospiraceae bacterium]